MFKKKEKKEKGGGDAGETETRAETKDVHRERFKKKTSALACLSVGTFSTWFHLKT